jgi:hypothetical protein
MVAVLLSLMADPVLIHTGMNLSHVQVKPCIIHPEFFNHAIENLAPGTSVLLNRSRVAQSV